MNLSGWKSFEPIHILFINHKFLIPVHLQINVVCSPTAILWELQMKFNHFWYSSCIVSVTYSCVVQFNSNALPFICLALLFFIYLIFSIFLFADKQQPQTNNKMANIEFFRKFFLKILLNTLLATTIFVLCK